MTTNEKIGATIVGGVILYLLFKKPKYVVFEKESGSSGGGGIMPIIMPLSTTTTQTAPQPTPTTPPPASTSKPATFPTCPSGQLWNPKTNKCENIVLEKEVGGGGTSSKPPDGTPPLELYDPCKTNGYGGTYDPASNTCLKSPYCGGGTVKLDNSGKAVGCGVSTPTGGGVVIGGTIPFSGKVPLTLENILM
jgi:hypothetical protein